MALFDNLACEKGEGGQSAGKVGDLDDKGLNRSTGQNGPLHGRGDGQKYRASPEHRRGSAPWQRRQGDVPDTS